MKLEDQLLRDHSSRVARGELFGVRMICWMSTPNRKGKTALHFTLLQFNFTDCFQAVNKQVMEDVPLEDDKNQVLTMMMIGICAYV